MNAPRWGRRLVGGLAALGLVLAGCPSPVVNTGASAKGSVQISAGSTALSAARTIQPGSSDLAIATYAFTLTRSGSATQSTSGASATASFSNLDPGTWTVSVSAANTAGVVLLTGSQSFSVSTAATSPVTVALAAPATGTGTINLSLTASPSLVSSVTGSRQNLSTGATTVINSSITGSGPWVYSETVTPGSYQVSFNLNASGSVVGRVIEVVDVFQGLSTAAAITVPDAALTNPPAAPGTPALTSGVNGVLVTVPTVVGASGYNVYYAAGATASTASTKFNASPLASLRIAVSGLSPGTQYSFVVTAVNAAGEGLASPVATTTTLGAGTPGVSVSVNNYGGLTLSPAVSSLAVGTSLVLGATGTAAAGSGWAWYLNGTSVGSSSSYTFSPTVPGTDTIEAFVTYNGVSYSGSMVVTVTSTSIITTVVGDLNNPIGIAVDASGNLFIADAGNNRVCKYNTLSGITTVAGIIGSSGYSGDGGLATSATLRSPQGIALDSSGNLYIADYGGACIRKVDHTSGVISTVVSGLNGPKGIAVDASGNLYIADTYNHRVCEYNTLSGMTTVAGTGTGGYNGDGPATSAQLYYPTGVAVDASSNLYIADSSNGRIRKVALGVITTVVAELNAPQGIAVDSSGNLYIADSGNSCIRKVTSGVITTVAGNGTGGSSGDGGLPTLAELNTPTGIAVDASGNLYIADTGNGCIRKVGP